MKIMEKLIAKYKQESSIIAGKEGEKFAEQWFKNSNWEYDPVEQEKSTISDALKNIGGKRPDFLMYGMDDYSVICVDAKYHTTNDGKQFQLTVEEINKFEKLNQFNLLNSGFINSDVWILLFPKEYYGEQMCWINLEELKNGDDSEIQGLKSKLININNRLSESKKIISKEDVSSSFSL